MCWSEPPVTVRRTSVLPGSWSGWWEEDAGSKAGRERDACPDASRALLIACLLLAAAGCGGGGDDEGGDGGDNAITVWSSRTSPTGSRPPGDRRRVPAEERRRGQAGHDRRGPVGQPDPVGQRRRRPARRDRRAVARLRPQPGRQRPGRHRRGQRGRSRTSAATPSASAPWRWSTATASRSASPATRGPSCWSTARTCSTKAGLDDPRHLRRRSRPPRPSSDSSGRGRDRRRHTSPATPSPSRPSRTSPWPTAASWSTTTARSRSTAPQCVETLRLLRRPASATTRQAARQDVDTTRATYFAGQAAMIIWSRFLLDELAGLRNDALPTCPECKRRPGVPGREQRRGHRDPGALSGTEPAPVRRGHLVDDHRGRRRPTPAQQFVEYMMSDGYEPWIAIAPEGKIPVRAGTDRTTHQVLDAWASCEVGRRHQGAAVGLLRPEVIDALTDGTDTCSAGRIPQGQGDLVGAIQGELPVPKARSTRSPTASSTADAAAKQAGRRSSEIAESIAVSAAGPRRRCWRRGAATAGVAAPARRVRAGPRGPPGRATC